MDKNIKMTPDEEYALTIALHVGRAVFLEHARSEAEDAHAIISEGGNADSELALAKVNRMHAESLRSLYRKIFGEELVPRGEEALT